MYYYIKGTVALTEAALVVLEAGGVGYALNTTYTSARSVTVGQTATFYTYLQVREDLMELYGFANRQEKECFQLLLGISGVGPKAALALLSAVTPDQLALAVLAGDEKVLTAAPGVGKKLAQRILLELKDKLAKGQLETPAGSGLGQGTVPGGSALEDAIAALMVLGYPRASAVSALQGLDGGGMNTDELVRAALKRLF